MTKTIKTLSETLDRGSFIAQSYVSSLMKRSSVSVFSKGLNE